MIIERFDYTPLPRDDSKDGRKYVLPNHSRVPSVTTILSATSDKTAILNWRRAVGEKRATEITAEASGRGTRMHNFLEGYVKTGELRPHGTNPYSAQSHQMATRVIEQFFPKVNEVWGAEVSLYFPDIYAGTTDVVGVYDNAPAIMDFKQANKPKKREWIEDYMLQLVAYAEAHNEVYNTKIRKGVVLICAPCLTSQEFVLEGSEFSHYVGEWWKRVEQYYLLNMR